MDHGCTGHLAKGMDMENTESAELGSQSSELAVTWATEGFSILRICAVFTM